VDFSDQCSDDDDSEAERNKKRTKKLAKNRQKYDDVREFLAQKEQMNVFGLKPMVSMVHEDVLE
jgi:hypothetical protein